MSQGFDVDSFLKKGYWQNTRARSPEPNVFTPQSPVQSSSYVDPTAPRRLPFHVVGRPRCLPPPPSVEDEIESLSKELGSLVSAVSNDEPPNRGDVEQLPIFIEVHEHNPERRFVLVPNSSDSSSDDSSAGTRKRSPSRRRPKSKEPRTETYEANTGRKYDVHASSDGVDERDSSDKKHDVRPARDRRRTKLDDLPAIVTETNTDPQPRESRKAKSTTGLEQTGNDYFSPRESARSQAESLLSPDVIKHSTRGKDRAYWDGGGSNPNSQNRNRPAYSNEQRSAYESKDSRYKESRHKSAHSASPTFEKRQSTLDLPTQTQTRRAPKESYDRTRQDTETHPTRVDRKESSRTYGRPERESISQRSSYRDSRDSRDSPPYDSSEDELQRRRHEESRRRRKSFVRDGRSDYLETPVETRSKSRRRTQLPTPDPTVRGSQGSVYESSSSHPRSSTFPRESKSSSDEDRSGRPLSRASTARSALSSAASVVIPAVIAAATSAATDSSTPTNYRKSTLPPLPKSEFRSERSSTSNVSSNTSRQNLQQPSRHSPPPPPPPPHQNGIFSNGSTNGVSSNNGRPTAPPSSSRQYTNEVENENDTRAMTKPATTTAHDGLPSIPHCPRTREEAGHVDWLTFPRCDNFNICPSCYEQAFARGRGARFAHALVPAPFRPSDRPLACDFGRSPWYQLAWLQTLKDEHPDLALFHSIRAVLDRARTQDQLCAGPREAYRPWFSIRDPGAGAGAGARPVPGFAACYTCARLVEAALPNLTGVFVPLDSEPSLNVCAMHPYSPAADEANGTDTRERFLKYLFAFNTVSDNGIAARRSPDIQDLADRIGALAAEPECRRGVPVHDAWWYVMRSIPEFTVCEACFKEVVAPALPVDNRQQQQKQQQQDEYSNGNGNGPSVAGDFHYRPQRLPVAACQLYSDRMRDIFNKAVRRRDIGYLGSSVRERRAREQEYYANIAALDRQQYYVGPERTAQEAERLLNEWRKWE